MSHRNFYRRRLPPFLGVWERVRVRVNYGNNPIRNQRAFFI
jgi:hypothetical protein